MLEFVLLLAFLGVFVWLLYLIISGTCARIYFLNEVLCRNCTTFCMFAVVVLLAFAIYHSFLFMPLVLQAAANANRTRI